MATPLKDTAWLQWIEKLADPSAPDSPGLARRSSAYRCRLEEQPDHLVPGHCFRDQAGTAASDPPLFLNPNCWFAQNGEPPPGLDCMDELFSGLRSKKECALWIRDPGCGTMMPFWLNSDLGNLLSGLRATDPAPASLPLENRRFLSMAGVLVPEAWIETCTQQWARLVFHSGNAFRQKGFVPVRRLIHPFHLSALRRYYRYLIRTGQMPLGDSQCSRRYFAHNEPAACFFHHQLCQAVSALVGEPLKPSYVYVGSYQEGARLEKHTDREQCEFSLTFCLDYSPEPQLATPWPIQLHTPSGKTTVFQAIGDGLLYRGREIPHSRTLLPLGHTSTSIFFHYVAKDFSGPLS